MLADIHVHALERAVEAELRRGRPEIAEREAEALVFREITGAVK